jgi:UDP-N-acetylmuramate dehydrogenase
MPIATEVAERLQEIPDLRIVPEVLLSRYTRFGIGGPAALYAESATEKAFTAALRIVCESGIPSMEIGEGTNLIVSDDGFAGIVLRFVGQQIESKGMCMRVEAGALLQSVVDRSIERNLQGMETMTGIPGSLGAAVYGNAGAYGHSIQERAYRVHYVDEVGSIRSLSNQECEFTYRSSIFKQNKQWVILSVELCFEAGDRTELQHKAHEIRVVRDAKYPPTMKCAGSVFKNCFFNQLPSAVQAEIPPALIREGKVPSAWFLEQVGVKGLRRGDIQVAAYHANLIYNDGAGTAADLVAVIQDLKNRVQDRFGFTLEEEVQYIGFNGSKPA